MGATTWYAAVRFGNVTHPDARRCFMTVEEAVGLILLSGLETATRGLDAEGAKLKRGKAVKAAESFGARELFRGVFRIIQEDFRTLDGNGGRNA